MAQYFYWLEEGVIAGSRFPEYESIVRQYRDAGIVHVINLTGDQYKNEGMSEFTQHRLPITDFSTPDRETVDRFFKITQSALRNNEAVVVHCYAGCGRTGTMLALWLMKYRGLNADDAIRAVRAVRPCALENQVQVSFVRSFSGIHSLP